MKVKNEATGEEVHLEETNDIDKLQNQLHLLGMHGLFYSPWAREIQEKIKYLKEKIED